MDNGTAIRYMSNEKLASVIACPRAEAERCCSKFRGVCRDCKKSWLDEEIVRR